MSLKVSSKNSPNQKSCFLIGHFLAKVAINKTHWPKCYKSMFIIWVSGAFSDLKMVSQSALWYVWNSRLNLCKFEISHQFTGHFGSKLHCQGDWANSWHILEMLQGSCLKVCKVLGEPTQILEKFELVTKIMVGYHGNNKFADFY